jgi:endonuclease-3 related protein
MHLARGWHWDANTDAFEIAVGSILVQNTAWTNVERALDRLRAADVLEPAKLGALPVEELEDLIRPSGQYRQKAKKLQALLALAESQGGFDALMALDTTVLRSALLATWGIGPETADAIVLYSAKRATFVIDAYTQRVFGRLGLGPGSIAYGAWQCWFEEALPNDDPRASELYGRFHALIVLHAKHLCRKLQPRCAACVFAARCPAAVAPQS